MKYIVWPSDDGIWTHVYPVGDEAEHETEGKHCWCRPDIQPDEMLIIHNSFDGREFFEDEVKL